MVNWWPQVLSGFPCDISLGEKIWEARSIAAELPRFSHLGGDILPGHDCVDGLFAFASLNRHWTQGKVDSYERTMPRWDFCPCSVDFGSCLFEPHATCPETELAKSEIIVERASAMFAFSILFSTCKAPVPQLGAVSINCCPPSFRFGRNRVISFNLTRPPTLTRVHIKEALILSASQLSSTKKNEQEHLSLSSTCSTLEGCQTSARCQTVADCQTYGP